MQVELSCKTDNCSGVISEWNFDNVTCSLCGTEWETDYDTNFDDDIVGPWITGKADATKGD